MKRAAGFAVALAAVLAALVIFILVRGHSLQRGPWLPIGVVLMAGGAVGLVVLAVMHAYNLQDEETREAARQKRGT